MKRLLVAINRIYTHLERGERLWDKAAAGLCCLDTSAPRPVHANRIWVDKMVAKTIFVQQFRAFHCIKGARKASKGQDGAEPMVTNGSGCWGGWTDSSFLLLLRRNTSWSY